MNPIQKIKQWRDRRFQKRVLKALDATITEDGIVFNKTLLSESYIMAKRDGILTGSLSLNGKIVDTPTINNDAIHDDPAYSGHPI